MSWCSWNLTDVLKSAIVLNSFGQNVLIWTFVMLSLWHCIHFVLYLVNSTLSVLLAYLITYLLQFCLTTNNIYEDRKNVYFLCLEPHETDKNVLKLSWNFVNIGSRNFTFCFWEPWESVTDYHYQKVQVAYGFSRELWSIMGPSYVSCHPTQVSVPQLIPSQRETDTWFAHPGRIDLGI